MLWITGRVDTFYYIKNFCYMKATDNLIDFKRKLKGFKELLFLSHQFGPFNFAKAIGTSGSFGESRCPCMSR